MIKPDEFLKKHGFDEEEEKDNSLEEQTRERARELKRPNAGTPHDWEDWEKHKAEQEDSTKNDNENDK